MTNTLHCLSMAVVAAVGSGAWAAAASAASARPNFLFIITDDQDAHSLRAYNPATTLQTPEIDRADGGGDDARRRVSDGCVYLRRLRSVATLIATIKQQRDLTD